MQKSAAAYEQGRLRRSVTESSENSGGIDPSAFAADNQRDRSAMRKKTFETQLVKLNEQIHRAQRDFHRTHRRHPAFDRWQKDRARIIVEIRDLDRELTNIRNTRRKMGAEYERTFERMFMKMSKEMLAGPVYDRILTATIHRTKEQASDDKSPLSENRRKWDEVTVAREA